MNLASSWNLQFTGKSQQVGDLSFLSCPAAN